MKATIKLPRAIKALSTSLAAILLALSTVNDASAQTNTTNGPNATLTNGVFAGANMSATGAYNSAYGNSALRFNTTGTYNTAIGSLSLKTNVVGTQNTAIGYAALTANTANLNTAVGSQSLSANTTGGLNTALGAQALRLNDAGASNVAVGYQALYRNTSGGFNVAIGDGALLNNTTGSGNVGIGEDGGSNLTVGINNICIGNKGLAADTGIIRIGTTGTQTDTFLTGIIHGNGSGLTGITSASLTSGLTLGGTTAGTFSGPLTGNVTGNVTGTAANVTGIVAILHGGTGSATKNFVDLTTAQSIAGVKTFSAMIHGNITGNLTGNASTVSTVGGVTAANVAAGANLANASTALNTASAIVRRNASGNFSAGTITGNLAGNASTATSAISFTGGLAGDITGTQGATVVSKVGGVTAANVAAGANLANAATPLNLPNTIVMRDASGSFSDTTVTHQIADLAVTTPKLANAAVTSPKLAANLTLGGTTSGTFSGPLTGSVTGTFTASGDSDMQGNILKNPVLGMLLSHPSFTGSASGAGAADTVLGDGKVNIVARSSGTYSQLTGSNGVPLDKPGTFMSARVGIPALASATTVTYVLMGQGGGVSSPVHGFGFKSVGTTLKGVTMNENSGTTEVDLMSLTPFPGQLNLLAVRRATSVEFYVNGALKGSSSTNLPTSGDYVIRSENNGAVTDFNTGIGVGFMTLGIPMF